MDGRTDGRTGDSVDVHNLKTFTYHSLLGKISSPNLVGTIGIFVKIQVRNKEREKHIWSENPLITIFISREQ